jgi:predicted MFS family arabinose efflux permease
MSTCNVCTVVAAYVYLYALALVPCGLLADKLPSRSPLLSVGVAAWSIFTLAAGAATNFESLLLTRIGLAAAQSAQVRVLGLSSCCFSEVSRGQQRLRHLQSMVHAQMPGSCCVSLHAEHLCLWHDPRPVATEQGDSTQHIQRLYVS